MTVPPVLYYSGVWPNPVLYVIPTTGPLLLLGEAFDQVSARAVAGRVRGGVPDAVCVGLWWVAKVLFVRYVIARSGGM